MTVTTTLTDSATTTRFLWLYLTDKCQEECTHCATNSSPSGTHGSMTPADWLRILDEAAAVGVRQVQFVGGEPTLHPALPELITRALEHAMAVEVFSNMVKISPTLWEVFSQTGVSLATSYYSDDDTQHAAITQRPTLPRIRDNIAEARRRGIPLRAGVIDLGKQQRVAQARTDLVNLGVPLAKVGYDKVRGLGRAAEDTRGCADQLCGGCGNGVAAIDPEGQVRPCLFAKWVTAGHVNDGGLGELLDRMPGVRDKLIGQGMPARLSSNKCQPGTSGEDCYPHNVMAGQQCQPGTSGEDCYPHNV